LFSVTTMLCRARTSEWRMPRGCTDSWSASLYSATVLVERKTR